MHRFALLLAATTAVLFAPSAIAAATGDVVVQACVEDAILCANGVVLERDPKNNCAFPKCPDAASSSTKNNVITKTEETVTLMPTPSPTPQVTVIGASVSSAAATIETLRPALLAAAMSACTLLLT